MIMTAVTSVFVEHTPHSVILAVIIVIISLVIARAVAGACMRAKPAASNEVNVTCTVPTSVNYHFLRTCNYQCGFCFHTAKTSYILEWGEIQTGLRMLQEAGMQKINFSGGEVSS